MSVIVHLGNAANTATFSTVDTLTSGAGADTIALTGAITNASIDLGAGSDTLTFANGANSATVANTETVTGGSGADTVTLGSALTAAMSVDLGGGSNKGSNKLTLANVANTGTLSNVQSLVGGTAADTVTLGTAIAAGSIDLGAGSDTLTFANGANSATVALSLIHI